MQMLAREHANSSAISKMLIYVLWQLTAMKLVNIVYNLTKNTR